MKTLVSVELMRKSDEYTIKNFIESKELMFRAGEGVFKSYTWQGRTAIVCGSGNNAGDGYVLALLLKQSGFSCTLFLLKEKFSDDGLYYFEKCREAGIEYVLCDENTDFSAFSQIVDCIFGTGFKGEVTGLAKTIIDKINSSSAFVISVDINSGLNADSGMGNCVISDLTVSIGYLKAGFYLGSAREKIKKIVNCDIGITLLEAGYTLIEKGEKIHCDADEVPYPECDLPIDYLEKLAREKGCFIKSRNILTNGEKTCIFE